MNAKISTRKIYLFRHAEPETNSGETLCGYPSDVALSEFGHRQNALLHAWVQSKNISAVYTSPALRCRQTAEAFCQREETSAVVVPLLREMELGDWEGIPFTKIRSSWPELYEARGKDLAGTSPPGGESFLDAGLRMQSAMEALQRENAGDIVLVSHAGIIRGWLCQILNRPRELIMEIPQPFAGLTEIEIDANGKISILRVGVQVFRLPSDEMIEELLRKHKTPDETRRHCHAVAECAEMLCQDIRPVVEVDEALLLAACKLHDLVRNQPNHPQAGAKILCNEGYPEIADLIKSHHDLPRDASPEAELLFLADKLVLGTKRVSLEKRFLSSKEHCRTEEALLSWSRRYKRAKEVAKKYGLCV